MQFLTRLARTAEQLERVAQKYEDEDLKALVAELYKQLTVVINILEKIYSIYTELDILVRTDLKIEPGLYLGRGNPPATRKNWRNT
jgi:NADP-dependent 3-hydroxy acid dehydrogenase YdfG